MTPNVTRTPNAKQILIFPPMGFVRAGLARVGRKSLQSALGNLPNRRHLPGTGTHMLDRSLFLLGRSLKIQNVTSYPISIVEQWVVVKLIYRLS